MDIDDLLRVSGKVLRGKVVVLKKGLLRDNSDVWRPFFVNVVYDI